MNKATSERYLKRFNHHMAGRRIKPDEIKKRLIELASEQTGNSWRETRNAFAEAIRRKAKAWSRGDQKRLEGVHKLLAEVKAMKNPVRAKERPQNGSRPKLKGIREAQVEKMLSKCSEASQGHITEAVIKVMQLTGARPNELMRIVVMGDEVFIPGSKKTADRGLDRTIKVNLIDAAIVAESVKVLEQELANLKDPQRKIRSAFKEVACLAFRSDKHPKPTPYTLRHQFGSDLKAEGRSRVEIAYLMGHQATASVDQYGDPRSSSRKSPINVEPAVSQEVVESLVRVTHNDPSAVKREANLSSDRGRSRDLNKGLER